VGIDLRKKPTGYSQYSIKGWINAGSAQALNLTINDDGTSGHYQYQEIASAGVVLLSQSVSTSNVRILDCDTGAQYVEINIQNTQNYSKCIGAYGGGKTNSSLVSGVWTNTSDLITSIKLQCSSRVYDLALYGAK
jgi:hypothetical protein